jgi:hypothetical protein
VQVTFASINTPNGVVSRVRRDNFALVCLGSQAVAKDVHDDVEAGFDGLDEIATVGSSKQAGGDIPSVQLIPSFTT